MKPKFLLTTAVIILGIFILVFIAQDVVKTNPDLFSSLSATTSPVQITQMTQIADIAESVNSTIIQTPSASISAMISNTPTMREKGLSGRDPLNEGQGMLFIFDEPGVFSFWMKDMKFPIDMVWIDTDKKIVDVDANVATSTYPNTFMPKSPVLYVLELNAGSAARYGLIPGTTLNF